MKIILIMILLPFYAIGQHTLEGRVSDKTDSSGISYATIALMKSNTGINADVNGKFILTTQNLKQHDTLIISSVGYEMLKISMDDLPADMNFRLAQKQTTLNEVLINTRREWIYTVLNKFGNCGTHYYSATDYISQLAQHFHSDTGNYVLGEVEICKYAIAIIDPDKCIFRLRIYGMDPATGAPAADLTDSIIEVKTDERRTSINLEKYKINIPVHDFYIAVEWLKIPYNASREKMKINGKKTYYTDYSPLICCKDFLRSDIYHRPASPGVWIKDYTGRWMPMPFIERLMISAKIKY